MVLVCVHDEGLEGQQGGAAGAPLGADAEEAHYLLQRIMAGFWKIDKTWVQEWGLTGNEALLLADLITWPECGVGERAERIKVSRQTLYALRRNLDKKCKETLQSECKETLQKVLRNFTTKCKETLHTY
jgi:hypothetical protein